MTPLEEMADVIITLTPTATLTIDTGSRTFELQVGLDEHLVERGGIVKALNVPDGYRLLDVDEPKQAFFVGKSVHAGDALRLEVDPEAFNGLDRAAHPAAETAQHGPVASTSENVLRALKKEPAR